MSGIFIPGMEMPIACAPCKVRGMCGLWRQVTLPAHLRHPNCPLVPVPDHGRLIDADALSDMLEKYKTEYALKAEEDITHLHKAWGLNEVELMSESLPTIIPADPAKEGEG